MVGVKVLTSMAPNGLTQHCIRPFPLTIPRVQGPINQPKQHFPETKVFLSHQNQESDCRQEPRTACVLNSVFDSGCCTAANADVAYADVASADVAYADVAYADVAYADVLNPQALSITLRFSDLLDMK